MTAKRNIRFENAIRDSINQTISEGDLDVPKICKVDSIKELLRIRSNIPPSILRAYNRKGKMPHKSVETWRVMMDEQDIY